METKKSIINMERLTELLWRVGKKETDFCKELFGEKTHLGISYFKGLSDIKASTLIKIAELLGCRIDDLLEYEGSNSIEKGSSTDLTPVSTGGSYMEKVLEERVRSLQKLMDEKQGVIEILKKHNSELTKCIDLLHETGQISEAEKS